MSGISERFRSLVEKSRLKDGEGFLDKSELLQQVYHVVQGLPDEVQEMAERRKMFLPSLFKCFRKSESSRKVVLDGMLSTVQAIISLTGKFAKEDHDDDVKKIQTVVMALLRSPEIIELAACRPDICIFTESALKLKHAVYDGMEIDLSCPICLDILYKPVGLNCGHTYCRSCAKRAAGMNSKCPMCRKDGVYINTIPMKKMSSVLKARFRHYYHQRDIEESQKLQPSLFFH